jgi:hypothetical protein
MSETRKSRATNSMVFAGKLLLAFTIWQILTGMSCRHGYVGIR